MYCEPISAFEKSLLSWVDSLTKFVLQALGRVMAIAVSEISGHCHVKGKGTACVLAEAHMEKTAEVCKHLAYSCWRSPARVIQHGKSHVNILSSCFFLIGEL